MTTIEEELGMSEVAEAINSTQTNSTQTAVAEPPEEVAAQEPEEAPAGDEENNQDGSQTPEETAGSADADAEGSEDVDVAGAEEEEDENLQDFVISEEETPEGSSPEESTLLSILSKQLGSEFSSPSDVISFVEKLKQPQQEKAPEAVNQPPVFPGLSPELSEVIAPAIDEGILTSEEVIAGKLLIDFKSLSNEDLYHDYLQERGLTPEQIAEKLEAVESDPSMREVMDIAADVYAERQNARRERIINEVKAERSRIAEQKRLVEVQREQARQKYLNEVDSAVSEMGTIPGTVTKLTPEEKANVAKVMKNGDLLQQLLWKDPSNRDTAYAAQQIARMMYTAKIAKDLKVSSRNIAKKELIDNESNITVGNGQGKPVTTNQTGKTALEHSLSLIDEALNK